MVLEGNRLKGLVSVQWMKKKQNNSIIPTSGLVFSFCEKSYLM